MRKLSYLAAFALAATAAFTACKKDDDKAAAVTGAARKSTLIANQWVLTASAINNISQLDSLDACEKDDYYTFAGDSTYKVHEGPIKCGTAEVSDSGIVFFNSDYTKMTQDGLQGDVTEFTEKSFSVKATVPILGVVTATFSKK